MKNCEEIRSKLNLFLDKEAGDEESSIREHIESCESCQGALGDLVRVSEMIREQKPKAPETLAKGIRKRLRDASRGRGATSLRRLAAAAVFIALALWGLVLSDDQAPSPRLSDIGGAGNLAEFEQRVLYSEPTTRDEWMKVVLSGEAPE
ncbi:MAG: zf-HC2 domain-containing protein [Planctomycetes bacterium]|nr:zf-HC2 domain-containing protein [Planctomycetota bacterium]